ncbi:helix-turn-helix domain-containing protein [Streptomonospora algeriensis]|uniref:Helix-turn-helix domain-containing protein n=1 Tax=Streptomonospora algeriensis TaxID=995084 RepID=A0ABW3BH82_9ACTN
MLGVRRPSLNRVLKEFERDGLVSLSCSSIALLDRKRLAERAR